MTQKKNILSIVSISFVALICVLCCVFFVGCSIDAPNVSVSGSIVSWDNVRNASSYEVDINGEIIEIEETSFNVIPFIQSVNTTKEVRVRAITTNRFLGNSNFSEPVEISTGSTKLNTPTNFTVTASETSCLLNWDRVPNADSYCVRTINTSTYEEQYFYTSSNTINLFNRLDSSGEFSVAVFAYSNAELSTYAPSDYSESATFVMNVTLDTPTNLNLIYSNGNLIATWNSVENAATYSISILDGNTYSVNADTSTELQRFNLSNAGISLNNGESLFISVSACGRTNSGYTQSPYSDMVAYFGNGSQSDYANVKYNFQEGEIDLVANSYTELEEIVHFGLFYRITNMRLFINYNTTNANSDYDRAIHNYDEIMYVYYSESMTKTNGYYEYNIQFYHTNYPDKTADLGENISIQSTDVQPTSYTDTPRADDYDDFAINDKTQTMMVYNSDQLYYAVEYGNKPVFPVGNSPAETVYETAKDILREIVSDDMTDYEKALAIFDWLCYTVHYDYDLVELGDILNQSENPWEIHDYRGFYIEGVFYDGGQAVCDGIAKTYALLCGIEGIECYKVAGYGGLASGYDNSEPVSNHAWNKIKLDLDNDGTGEWYTVDATWNDYSEASLVNGVTTYVEYLSHSFFLHSDEWLEVNENRQIHVELSAPYDYYANTAFDYYTYTKYDGVNDLLIEGQDELSDLAEYVKSNNLQSIEFASEGAQSKYAITQIFKKDFSQIKGYIENTYRAENGQTYYIYIVYY